MSTSVATPSEHTKDKKSKWRMSNPFKKDDANGKENLAQQETRDSAYGSETHTLDPSPNPSTTAVPTISPSQAEAQGAQVETKTDSRGRVVTTTTTTTTTTTVASGDLKDIENALLTHLQTTTGEEGQVPAGEEVIVRKEESASSGPSSSVGHDEVAEPSIPAKNIMRNKSPHGGHLAPQNQYHVEAAASPPSSPTHPNFSYPGRQSRSSFDQQHPAYGNQQGSNRPRPPADPSYGQPPLNGNTASPTTPRQSIPPSLQPGYGADQSPSSGYPPRQSTAQSIRTAAAGIHGAGEALRGAFNSEVARRTGANQEEIAKHDATMQRGRQEIETGHFVKHPPPIPEVPTPTEEQPKEKKSSSKLKNVLRKKSPARNM